MNCFHGILLRLLKDEDGQDLIEYAFVLAFIVLVAIATMQAFAGSVALALGGMGRRITSVV